LEPTSAAFSSLLASAIEVFSTPSILVPVYQAPPALIAPMATTIPRSTPADLFMNYPINVRC
jgi:hypothetical protein